MCECSCMQAWCCNKCSDQKRMICSQFSPTLWDLGAKLSLQACTYSSLPDKWSCQPFLFYLLSFIKISIALTQKAMLQFSFIVLSMFHLPLLNKVMVLQNLQNFREYVLFSPWDPKGLTIEIINHHHSSTFDSKRNTM